MRNMVLKNQVLLGTVNAGRDAFENAIRDLGIFMERWPDAVPRGHHRPAPDGESRRTLLAGKANGIKNVVTFR